MKKIIAIITALAVSLAASAFAGQFGPMDTAPAEGQTTLGVGYFYHPAKYKMTNDSFVKIRVGQNAYATSTWNAAKATQNLAYLQAAYRNNSWEVYGRLGGSTMNIDDAFSFAGNDFKGGFKAFGTVGIRGTFPVSSVFSIGPFFEASLFSGYNDHESRTFRGQFIGDNTLDTLTVSEKIETENLKDINLGLSLQANLGKVTVYAGPFLYWTEMKASQSVNTVLIDGNTLATSSPVTNNASNKWEERGNLGGFAGFQVPLGQNLMFEAEGQLKSMVSVGGNLSYRF